jgi:hypothetical protein
MIFGMALMVLLVSAPLWAYDTTDFVTVAQPMQGDLLFYPVYAAGSGLQTKFTVINSSDTYSVVAKVVLRSHKYSQEVLDFLIYLSPNDTFDATISFANGKYQLMTSDNSLVLGSGVQATETAPLTFQLAVPCDGIVDNAGFGYIEVIETWAVDLPKDTDGTVPKISTSTYEPGIFQAYNAWAPAQDGYNTINTLSGYSEIDFVGADYAAYEATALQDYDLESKLGVAVETLLGDNARNTLCEIEAALAKNHLVLPYYDTADSASLPILTFPTKEALCPADWDAGETVPDGDEARGPFWSSHGDAGPFNVTYSLTYYDKEEHKLTKTCDHSPCPTNPELDLEEEVNFVLLDSPFAAGWARASFAQTTTCTAAGPGANGTGVTVGYGGAPIIPLIGHFTSDGFTLVPVAYTPPTVTRTDNAPVG